tara:strand:- start:2903 stop:4117 length:1215 start_codon:yes stop_codon:yes gene_type:complete
MLKNVVLRRMNAQLFIGVLMGVIVGLIAKDQAVLLGPIGEVFLRLLKMLIIPLVITSVVLGVINIGKFKKLGKIGSKLGLYIIITTLIAAIIGIMIANRVGPGYGINYPKQLIEEAKVVVEQPQTLGSILVEIVPQNLSEAMTDGNILPLIFFSIFLALALTGAGKSADPIIKFFESLHVALIKMINWVMIIAPIGVFTLIASWIGSVGYNGIKPYLLFIATVLIGLLIHAILVLPSILMIIGQYSPMLLLKQLSPALALAFSTNSSLATLPITMDCLKKKVKISTRLVNTVTPIGAALNMDGTALFQASATLFIAQIFGFDLTIMQLIIIALTATFASFAAAAVPSAGLITMTIVLNAVGLPLEGIGLILIVDRILDMFRTTLNVFSDGIAAVIIARYEGELI